MFTSNFLAFITILINSNLSSITFIFPSSFCLMVLINIYYIIIFINFNIHKIIYNININIYIYIYVVMITFLSSHFPTRSRNGIGTSVLKLRLGFNVYKTFTPR